MDQVQERSLPRGGSFFRARFLFPWVANLCLHVAIMGYREDVAQPIAQSKGNRTRAGRAGLDGNAYFCRSINKSRNRNRSNSRSIGIGLGKNNRQSPSKQRSIMKKNKMKKILTAAFCAAMASPALAQGWPTGYEGVILQGSTGTPIATANGRTWRSKPRNWGRIFPCYGCPRAESVWRSTT